MHDAAPALEMSAVLQLRQAFRVFEVPHSAVGERQLCQSFAVHRLRQAAKYEQYQDLDVELFPDRMLCHALTPFPRPAQTPGTN